MYKKTKKLDINFIYQDHFGTQNFDGLPKYWAINVIKGINAG